MIAPILDELATDQVGKFVVAKVNIDEAPEPAARFGITSILVRASPVIFRRVSNARRCPIPRRATTSGCDVVCGFAHDFWRVESRILGVR